MQTKTIETGTFYRNSEILTREDENRTIEISFSSEEPYERFFGMEILGHKESEVNLDWLASGNAPFLKDHDPDKQIGVIEEAFLKSGKGRARIRFGKSEKAQEIYQDIKDGIRKNISVGYRVNKMILEKEENEKEFFRVVDWTPMEVSSVSIPADTTVGVNRQSEIKFKTEILEGQKMSNVEVIEEKIDTAKIAQEARKQEIDRIQDINKLGAKHNQRELAEKAIAEGWQLDEFRTNLLDNLQAKHLEAEAPAKIGLSKKEASNFSILRAIKAAATNNWTEAQFELECSREAEKKTGRLSRGFMVPSDVAWAQRDLTVGANTAGGFLVGTDHQGENFIDALRARLVIAEAGGRTLEGLQGDIAIPALNAKTAVAFVAEGSAPTEGAPTFRQVTMSPKTVAGYVDLSRKLMMQSDPSIEQVIRNDIAQQIASKIDEVAIEGGGSNEPTGITQTSGIGSVGIATNGGAITYGATIDIITEVSQDNALNGSLAYITTPQVVGKMRQTAKVGSTDSVRIMDESDMLNGYGLLQSTLVPSDLTKGSGSSLHAMIFGNFNELFIGFWSGLDVVVDTASLSTSGGTRISFFQDCDVAVRHAESFAACLDIDVS